MHITPLATTCANMRIMDNYDFNVDILYMYMQMFHETIAHNPQHLHNMNQFYADAAQGIYMNII